MGWLPYLQALFLHFEHFSLQLGSCPYSEGIGGYCLDL
jgi:hypothetical protein